MINIINVSLQISMYSNYCIFQTPSQKVAQNIQSFNIQVWFLYDLEGKQGKHGRHHDPNNIALNIQDYNKESFKILFM